MRDYIDPPPERGENVRGEREREKERGGGGGEGGRERGREREREGHRRLTRFSYFIRERERGRACH
jgi:hypothetical protein